MTSLEEDEQERIQIATAALRAISDNVPIVLLGHGVAVLPDVVLLELTANGLVIPGGYLVLRGDGREARVIDPVHVSRACQCPA